MQRIFIHPDLPTSITEVRLVKGIDDKWVVFISDRFGISCWYGASAMGGIEGIPKDSDLLDLALLHTKHSIRITLRN